MTHRHAPKMLNGDIVVETDDDGNVRPVLVSGVEAYGQKMLNRLRTIRGEDPFDLVNGLPALQIAGLKDDSYYFAIVSETLLGSADTKALLEARTFYETPEKKKKRVLKLKTRVVSQDHGEVEFDTEV